MRQVQLAGKTAVSPNENRFLPNFVLKNEKFQQEKLQSQEKENSYFIFAFIQFFQIFIGHSMCDIGFLDEHDVIGNNW